MLYISLLLWSDYINNAGKASVQHNEIIFLILVDSYGNSLANNLLHHQWPEITAVFKNLSCSWKLRRLITWTERDRKMCQKLLWPKLLTLSCSHFFSPSWFWKSMQPCECSEYTRDHAAKGIEELLSTKASGKQDGRCEGGFVSLQSCGGQPGLLALSSTCPVDCPASPVRAVPVFVRQDLGQDGSCLQESHGGRCKQCLRFVFNTWIFSPSWFPCSLIEQLEDLIGRYQQVYRQIPKEKSVSFHFTYYLSHMNKKWHLTIKYTSCRA